MLASASPRNHGLLEELGAAVLERGCVSPVIDQVLGLDQVREAHERLETHHGRGKVVLETS